MIQLNDFTGGLWIPGESGSPNPQPLMSLPSNALVVADNIEYLPGGGVKGRRGIAVRNPGDSLGNAPGKVRMLWKHYGRVGQTFETQLGAAAASVAGAGETAAWVNPTNVFSANAAYAVATCVSGALSEQLQVTDFGFAIPAAARVIGVQVEVQRFNDLTTATSNAIDRNVRLMNGGVAISNSLADTVNVWPYTATKKRYGEGTTDLWGATLTPAIVNSTTFGVAFGVRNAAAIGSAVATVDAVWIIVHYTDPTIEPIFLSAVEDGVVLEYQVEDAFPAWNPPLGGAGHDIPVYNPRAVSWPERSLTYLFDGTNPVLQFDGITIVTTPDDSVGNSARKGPFATLYRNRLWMTDPDELHFSVYASSINLLEFTQPAFDPVNQLSVNDRQGGLITGLTVFDDRLIILKDTCLWSFDGDPQIGGQLVNFSDRGCVAPDTIATTPFGVIYLAQDGLYLTNGTDPNGVQLSAPIRTLFTSRLTDNNYRTAIGVYHPRRDAYYLKLHPDHDEVYVLHQVRLANGETTLAWSHIPTLPFVCGTTWAGESDQGEIFFGTGTGGYILEADKADAVVDTFATGAFYISSEMVTSARPLDPNRREGRVYAIKALYRDRNELTLGLRYDAATTNQVAATMGANVTDPEMRYQRATVVDLANFGRFVALRSVSTSGPEFQLHEAMLDVKLRSQRVWR